MGGEDGASPVNVTSHPFIGSARTRLKWETPRRQRLAALWAEEEHLPGCRRSWESNCHGPMCLATRKPRLLKGTACVVRHMLHLGNASRTASTSLYTLRSQAAALSTTPLARKAIYQDPAILIDLHDLNGRVRTKLAIQAPVAAMEYPWCYGV